MFRKASRKLEMSLNITFGGCDHSCNPFLLSVWSIHSMDRPYAALIASADSSRKQISLHRSCLPTPRRYSRRPLPSESDGGSCFDLRAIMNQTPTKQNTISAQIILDCFVYQSDRNCTARMVQPKTYSRATM